MSSGGTSRRAAPATPGLPRRRLVRWSKSGLPLLAVLVLGASPPSVTGIEIVPASVVVLHDRPTTSFELEARLWTGNLADRRSIVETDGHVVTWTPGAPWLKLTWKQGFRARFSIDQQVQGTVTVRVEAGGKLSVPASITVVTGPAPGEDFLTATYTPGQVPDVALVKGVRNAVGGPCGLTYSAFVGGMGLGAVVGPCPGTDGAWETAVLARAHGTVVGSGQFNQQQNTVKAGDLQGARRTVPVALRVMLADDALSADQLAKLRESTMLMALAELQAANGVLAATRAGVELGEPDTATILPAATEVDGDGLVAISGCRHGDEITSTHDVPDMLNIYYVSWLYGTRGRACAPLRWRKYPVIFVEVHSELQTTLVHEIGHALGLTLPEDGHADIVGGLDLSNVMTKGYRDWDAGGRRRLTVGQVFRMNTDSASWLSWAMDAAGASVRGAVPRLGCQCGVGDPAGGCPRVRDDVAPPSTAAGSTDPWDCWDKLLLLKAPSYEEPMAILAGHRSRAPPEECSDYLPGWEANHADAVWVAFENLSRPGDCDSWAVVFYRRHAVQFLDLSEPDFDLTQVADELPVPAFPAKPLPVMVRLYRSGLSGFDAVAPEVVKGDVNYARTVFGPLNRSGITLLFDVNATSCPQTNPHPREIQVCYVAGLAAEGRVAVPRRVILGKRNGTTLAHFIGQALGLSALDPAGPDLPGNIMRPAWAERGKRLTLGQVFRINAGLGRLAGCNPTPCPPLELDAGP